MSRPRAAMGRALRAEAGGRGSDGLAAPPPAKRRRVRDGGAGTCGVNSTGSALQETATADDVIHERGRKRRRERQSAAEPEAVVATTGTANDAAPAIGAKSDAAARRNAKKKQREKAAKARRREEALQRRQEGNAPSVAGVQKGEEHKTLSKRQKKRLKYNAKHGIVPTPKTEPLVAGEDREEAKRRTSFDAPRKAPAFKSIEDHYSDDDGTSDGGVGGKARVWKERERFLGDYSEDEKEEVYMGRRAKRTAGKGGNSQNGRKGKGRGKGPVHATKAERRSKREEKKEEKKQKNGKGAKGKGKGKGKGKKKKGGKKGKGGRSRK